MARKAMLLAAAMIALSGSMSAIGAGSATAEQRAVHRAAPDATGNLLYVVNLKDDAVQATDASDESPAVGTRDPRVAQDSRSWHKPKTRKLVKQLERDYGVTARSMTSYGFPTFAAYMSPDTLAAIKKDARVDSVEAVYEANDFSAWADRTDATYCTVNSCEIVPWGKQVIGTDDLRSVTNGGFGATTVYDLDAGFPNNPALSAVHNAPINASLAQPSPEHATHVMGIIAATIGNGLVRGVDPGINLWAVNSGLNDSDIEASMDWVLADLESNASFGVANISRNSERWSYNWVNNDPSSPNYGTPPLHRWIRRLSNRALVVQSAGNQGANACTYAYAPPNGTPSDSDGVLVVGGIDENGARAAPFDNTSVGPGWIVEAGSNSGPCVEVWAPAQHVMSTWTSGSPQRMVLSGTSMAAPHITALAARYGNRLTMPVEREKYIRAHLFSTGFSDPITGGPIQVPSYTTAASYAIPSKIAGSYAFSSSVASGYTDGAVNDGAYLYGAWNSGSNYGWITVNLGSIRTVTSLRLTPERSPYTGSATINVYADNTSTPSTLVATYSGSHNILEPIAIAIPNVSAYAVRVEAWTGDSWTAWREIEVYGY